MRWARWRPKASAGGCWLCYSAWSAGGIGALRDVDILLDGEHDPTAPGLPDVTTSAPAVHTRFAEIAAAQPDSVAVSWADGQLTYRELDALADRLATSCAART